MKKKDYIEVGVTVGEDGSIEYTDKGTVLVKKVNGVVIECRETPLYTQLSPCPYCDAVKDKGHNPIKHIDSRLGKPI